MLKSPQIKAKDVVNNWWMSNGVICNSSDHDQLVLMASIFLGVPRLLEVAKYYMDANLIHSNEIKLDKESIYGFYFKLFDDVIGRYRRDSFDGSSVSEYRLSSENEIDYNNPDNFFYLF